MTSAYLCSETLLFEDFNTKTFKSIVKYIKKTPQQKHNKTVYFWPARRQGRLLLLLAFLHGKKHSPSPVVGRLAGWVGGLAGLAGWAGWLDGLAGWAGWLGWLAELAGWAGWLAGWLAGLAGWLG